MDDPNNPVNPPAEAVVGDGFVPHAATQETLECWARGMHDEALLDRIKADLDTAKPTLHIETAQRFAAKVAKKFAAAKKDD